MTRILILGAASAIAQSYSRRRAGEGATFILAGRREGRLKEIAADLLARGAAAAEPFVVDLAVIDAIERSAGALRSRLGEPGEIVLAYGSLGVQATVEQNLADARALLDTNFTSAVLWTLALLKDRDPSLPLTLIAIGSVAGDRGRASNFLYGAAKGGFDRFLQGLQQKYEGTAIRILIVKPGLVDTPMTADFDKRGLLWSSPERIAADMHRAVVRGRRVIYTPWFWWPIMMVIRHLPWFVFRRLKI